MATVGYKRKRRKSRRLSLRRTMLVWIGGAIVGWAVMVTTVYNLLRFPEDGLTTAKIDMEIDPAVVANEAERLNQIEPAAGGSADTNASMPPSDANSDEAAANDSAENSGEAEHENQDADEESDTETPPTPKN